MLANKRATVVHTNMLKYNAASADRSGGEGASFATPPRTHVRLRHHHPQEKHTRTRKNSKHGAKYGVTSNPIYPYRLTQYARTPVRIKQNSMLCLLKPSLTSGSRTTGGRGITDKPTANHITHSVLLKCMPDPALQHGPPKGHKPSA